MKKYLLLSIIFLGSFTTFAQAPHAFSFQAVARTANGEVIANQNVSFQISLIQGSITGNVVYSEIHSATTNITGLVTLAIGTGETNDDFSAIDWSSNTYFVKVEIDASGGSDYIDMGTTQLLSVPYALYAEKSGTTNNSSQALPINTIYFKGGTLTVLPYSIDTLPWDNKLNITHTYDANYNLIYNYEDSTSTEATSYSDGLSNTEKIITKLGDGNYAAKYCYDLDTLGYNDWYLPAIDEVYAARVQSYNLDYRLYDDFDYISSTEVDAINYLSLYHLSHLSTLKITKQKFVCVRRN